MKTEPKPKVKTVIPEPRYPIGISGAYRFEMKRGRVISCKFSEASGWWYEIRFPDNTTRSVPEAEFAPMED